MNKKILTFCIVCLASAMFAEDFKTLNGKEYKDATITRVEPDGIIVKTKSGITKIYFTELPQEVQHRFGYHAQQAADYSAQQNAVMQKANEDQARQADDQARQAGYQALQIRYQQLQQEEDGLLLQIGQAKEPGPTHQEYRGKRKKTIHDPNPLKAQLPFLESHVKDVRREKNEVRKQLEKVQRQ
jgi:hypothetical protein